MTEYLMEATILMDALYAASATVSDEEFINYVIDGLNNTKVL